MTILKSATIGVTASGSNGSASGNADSETFTGEIAGIYVNYAADCPNTADVTITDKRSGVTIWTLNNANTDVYKVPAIGKVTSANAAILDSEVNAIADAPYVVDQGVNVAIAGANSATNQVVVTVLYRK
jgi:hypothetical protein